MNDILQSQTTLHIRQRVRFTVNQYEVHAVNADGSEGEILAFAQQKRMAFREQVTLYTDDTKSVPVLGFKARQVMDLAATYDVTDASGAPIGLFRKNFGKSFLRSTWHLEQPGYGEMVGQERSMWVAVLRRFLEALDWLPYHFDFELGGQPAFSVERQFTLRDRYTVTIHDPRIDRRLIVAMAVGLDALQAR